MPNNTYFNRYEYKYIISIEQRVGLLKSLAPFCVADEHAKKKTGIYQVNSVYFDSRNLNAYFEKVEGESERRKLRLRYYNNDPKALFFEVKRKSVSNVSKSKVRVTNESYTEVLKLVPFDLLKKKGYFKESDRNTVNEIQYLIRVKGFQPKVSISYHRLPLFSELEDRLRLTFDSEIMGYRGNILDRDNAQNGKFLINPSHTVFEIKFNTFLPKWLIPILQEHNCSINKISKFSAGIERIYDYCVI